MPPSQQKVIVGECDYVVDQPENDVDVKLYVSLENSSSSATTSSQQPHMYCNNSGYNIRLGGGGGGDPGRSRVGSDMNNGRCPHHVKLGDSEWGNVDRPACNQTRVPYQVRTIGYNTRVQVLNNVIFSVHSRQS